MGKLKQLTNVLNPKAKHEIRVVVSTPMYTYLLEKAASLGFNTVSEYVRHLIALNMERETVKVPETEGGEKK